ncbi:MAG: HlyC/CorC family transporter [Clostridia bacterium]|nr:HlyC/CorC family transporter [Clostridia bacterium]
MVPPSIFSNLICSNNFTVADGFAIAGILLLILFSAFFSASETAFSRANPLRIKSLADEKIKGARRATYICDNYDKALSTILVGNNLVNIASTTLCAYLLTKFIVSPTLSNLLNTVVMTIVILIFGEILPKSVAGTNPDKWALRFSGFLYFLMKLLIPITFLFHGLQKLVNKKQKEEAQPTVTEDELETIIDTMSEEGVINQGEADILQGALDLSSRTVYDIMTPRVDVIAIDVKDDLDTIKNIFIEHQFSRVPVYEDDKDNIIGILNQKDFIINYLKGKRINIRKLMSKPMFVTETTKVDDVIRTMQKEKKHLAIVLDEYGGTSGIVTMEDALEEVVGEIYDEHDDEVITEPIKKTGEDTYIVDPDVSVEDLYDYLEIEHLPETKYSSVGGMVYELLETLPEVGAKVEIIAIDDILNEHNDYEQIKTLLSFKITKTEDNRITELALEVTRQESEE